MKLISIFESDSNLTIEKAVDLFHEKCKQWRNEVNFDSSFNFVLCRGMKNQPDIFVSPVRKDRRPLDTPQKIHDILDKWFDKNYGIRYRSSAMFAVFGKSNLFYGKRYIVFPIGNFEYCYSNKVDDIVEYLEDEYNMIDDIDSDELEDMIFKRMDVAKYTDKNLLDLDTDIEIMIHCNEYLAIDNDQFGHFMELYNSKYPT